MCQPTDPSSPTRPGEVLALSGTSPAHGIYVRPDVEAGLVRLRYYFPPDIDDDEHATDPAFAREYADRMADSPDLAGFRAALLAAADAVDGVQR